ncbi:MAG: AraC family transcriptional regulator [Clostridiales bacterium]|nr:AraC family transcriptional regulator [Clostridiales bacterium]
MKKAKRETVEYRYYEMPSDIPVLALLGENWIRPYGELGPEALHFHNHLEIGFCYEGHGTLVIEEQTKRYQPGTYSIIPHNVCHTTVSDGGMLCRCEYLFIDVESFLESMYPGDRRFAERMARMVNQRALVGCAQDNPKLPQLILALIDEMRQKRPFYLMSARGLLLTLLIELARAGEDGQAKTPSPRAERNLVILDALNYVNSRYNEDLKIRSLAEACHMSETHFRRVFREIMSIGPLEYINIVRVEMACNMLRATDYSMDTIARRSGYPTMTTFDRNFRRVTGCSPLQWKKNPSNYEQKLRNYRIAAFQGWR